MSEMKNSEGISRRSFLGLSAGIATSAITMGSITSLVMAKNITKIDVKTILDEEYETDVLVIGSGMAGLFASVKAHDAGARVMMVSKGRLGSSGQTPFAKGIFAFDKDKEKMSIDDFVNSVSKSALGTNNRQLAEHSLDRVKELKQWGFFDSALYNMSFNKPMKDRDIPLIERVMITNLIKENEKIVGAAGFSVDENKIIVFKAKSVILCTGAGGFKPNGFLIGDLTHDGTIMAYEIGAKVKRPPHDEKEGVGPGMPNGSAVGGSSAGLAIHKSEGIVPINDKCESTVKGLFAVGDALGSYMSGGIYTQIG